jgi:hypothetical protein
MLYLEALSALATTAATLGSLGSATEEDTVAICSKSIPAIAYAAYYEYK